MWLRCARVLDAAVLDRPELRTVDGRRANRERLVGLLSGITRGFATDALVAKLDGAKVVAAPVLDVGRAAEDPQLQAIGQVVRYAGEGRQMKAVAPPFRLDRVPPQAPRMPPALAADTGQVLRQMGYSDAEVTKLKTDGALG